MRIALQAKFRLMGGSKEWVTILEDDEGYNDAELRAAMLNHMFKKNPDEEFRFIKYELLNS